MNRLLLPTALVLLMTASGNSQSWDPVWRLTKLPFLPEQSSSEMAIVKAGFDTDQDGKGEFLCAWTDLDTNAVLMYEANGDNTYDLVWYWKFPLSTFSFAGIAVGELDENSVVDIIITLPSAVDTIGTPPRVWAFEWNGVQGQNAYGVFNSGTGQYDPTSGWDFELPPGTDWRPYGLTIEDIDADGTNELILGVRQGARGREVMVVSVAGEFAGFHQWQIEYNYRQPFNGSLYNVTTGDLDRDGNREIYAFVWNLFTMRIFECTGDRQYSEVFSVDTLYRSSGIDYGALDGVRVADVNNDGVNEMYIAGTESQNTIFIVTGISDISQMTRDDIKVLYTIPRTAQGRLRSMVIADPDRDGRMELLIAGERNGQIFSLEYKGTGDPADSTSWDLTVIFDVWTYGGLDPNAPAPLTPRFFYGSHAGDMDNDGRDEFVFVNYSSDFSVWPEDAYVWVIEIGSATSAPGEQPAVPGGVTLLQNYPNPFNPATTIRYDLHERSQVNLSVYTLLGEKVATLVDGVQEAGSRVAFFDGSLLASGVYLYRLTAGSTVQTRRMVLVR